MNRKHLLIVAAAIVVASLLSFLILIHEQKQSTVFGVAGSGTVNASEISAMKEIGVRIVRLDVSLSPQEEETVSELTSNGFEVIGILDYDTLGVRIENGTCVYNCNWSLEDWNESVARAIESYPEIHIWEIWNEPQVAEFQDGFCNGSTYNYFLMLKSAYSAIKSYNSSDTVLCLGGDMLYSYDGYQWARHLWGYGAQNYCDAVSLHLYTGFEYLMSSTVPGTSMSFYNLTEENLDSYEALTKKPVWITEVGIPSNNGAYPSLNNSMQKQAIFLNQTFSLLESKGFVKAVVWYNLEDSPNSQGFDFGLLEPNLSLKPSAYAYMKFTR